MIKRIALPVTNSCSSIYKYWSSKCSGGRLPTRKDINPKDIKHILPYISMIDVIDHGRDFRVRLIGSEVQRYIGHNCTDEFLSLGMSFERELYEPWFRNLISEQAVIMGTVKSSPQNGTLAFDREIISMPLMNPDHSEVSIILNVIERTSHWSKHMYNYKDTASMASQRH